MNPWISCKEKLPPLGKYVLARVNRDNWSDRTDQENVTCVVAKRVSASIEGNNQLPFQWNTFGPHIFFGQDVGEWALIPPRNEL